MQHYRVGILGYGFIGKVHAFGYATLPLYYDPPPLTARVTHVVTSRNETAEKARSTLGADVASTDFRVVTENPDVDIVHICTPNHLHRDALLSAMAHDKHIYCDKPLVASLDEVQPIRQALDTYRGVGQMTFQNRFLPSTMRAKQLADDGALGRIVQFRTAFLHGGNIDPQAPMKWKLSAEAGGGVIADLASHAFDLLDWIAGPIRSLSADAHIVHPQRPALDEPDRLIDVDAEDAVTMLARLDNGAVGTIEATKVATGSEDELRLEIHGTRGAVRFNLMDPHHLQWYDATAPGGALGGSRGWQHIDCGHRYGPPASGFPTPKVSIGWLRGHVACLAAFLQSIADGRPADPDLHQGIRIQEMIDAARQSAKDGQWVDLP